MQTTALASAFPERPSNDYLITDTKSCAKQRGILENAHAHTVWLHQRLPQTYGIYAVRKVSRTYQAACSPPFQTQSHKQGCPEP